MTARGIVLIKSTNDEKLADTSYAKKYLANAEYIETDEGILLDEVNWLDTNAFLDHAPDVSWVAFMGESTEEANILHIYLAPEHEVLPNTSGLYQMFHVCSQPVLRAELPDRNYDQSTFGHYHAVMTAIQKTKEN